MIHRTLFFSFIEVGYFLVIVKRLNIEKWKRFSLNNIYSEKHNNNDIFPVQRYISRIQILG